MAFDVFISYSSKQRVIADGVKHYLEENGIRCWMAPNSIPPSSSYPAEINKAIRDSRILLLVFSNSAAISPWVQKEVNQAVNMVHPILPFRIEQTTENDFFDYLLTDTHWIDAYPRYAEKLPSLLNSIKAILGQSDGLDIAKTVMNSSRLQKILPSECDNLSEYEEGMARAYKDGKWGYIDKEYNVVIPFEYDAPVFPFHDSIACVCKNDKAGFIDQENSVVIPFEYSAAHPFREGLAAVMNSSCKWGFINKQNDLLIPFRYDSVSDFENGKASFTAYDSYGHTRKGYVNKMGLEEEVVA